MACLGSQENKLKEKVGPRIQKKTRYKWTYRNCFPNINNNQLETVMVKSMQRERHNTYGKLKQKCAKSR